MNVIKMSILAVPFVFLLFVYGVYCPGIYSRGAHANEFPPNYQLQSCRLDSPTVELHSSSSTYEFDCGRENQSVCSLTEYVLSSGITIVYSFRKSDVEFILLMEDEITLKSHAPWMPWSATCKFLSVTLARKFYKYITQGRQPELVPFVTANYLKDSDDIALAEPANLYSEGEGNNLKILIKNYEGDAILMFPKTAVSQRIQHENEPTRIDLNISRNPNRTMLYKFSFPTSSQASSLNSLLN